MKSTGLFAELKNHPWIMALVIVFHLCLAILLGMNLSNDEKPDMPAAQQHKIINAVVVDGKIADAKKIIKKQEVKKIQPEEKKQKKEAEKKAEKKKRIAIEEERRKKKEIEEKKLEKKKELVEKEREKKKLEKEKLEKKKQIELKKKEQERVKKEKAEKERIELERIKQEKAKKEKARKKAEAEKKRKAEEERKHRAEEKAEFENALLEEEMAEEAAARSAMLQTQRQKYVLLIAQKVENNWLRPVTNAEGQSCDVIVTQTMKGDVLDVQLKSCTSDNAFQRSVERAVRKASPLPLPPNADVFDREIYFTFKPH